MQSSSARSITVSIVSHGHLELVSKLLMLLDKHSHEVIEKVVLTINIPEPDVLEGLKFNLPIERITNSIAKGFGANHNQAFKYCKTPWFLVLNPDIVVDQDLLAPMISEADADTGVMAPRIYEPNNQQPEQHRAIITPLEIFARKRASYASPVVPQWIPGLFMLFRRETFAQINGFDEHFFMYGEDFDICARMRLAKWKIQIIERLYIFHDARRASHINIKHLYWHLTSLFRIWRSFTFWKYFLGSPPENTPAASKSK